MTECQCRSSIRPKLARQSLGTQAEKATSLQYGDDAPPSHRRTNAVSADLEISAASWVLVMRTGQTVVPLPSGALWDVCTNAPP